MKTKNYKIKTPRARLSLPVTRLQQVIWEKKKYPKEFHSYKNSPELMKIYKILIDRPQSWENKVQYELNPREKIDLVFGSDYRSIFSYRVIENFCLNVGELIESWKIVNSEILTNCRFLKVGDLVLLRHDSRNDNLTVDFQVLSQGLFQDSSEDYRVFKIDSLDLKHIRKYLKLLDSEGVYEPSL